MLGRSNIICTSAHMDICAYWHIFQKSAERLSSLPRPGNRIGMAGSLSGQPILFSMPLPFVSPWQWLDRLNPDARPSDERERRGRKRGAPGVALRVIPGCFLYSGSFLLPFDFLLLRLQNDHSFDSTESVPSLSALSLPEYRSRYRYIYRHRVP